MATPTSPNKSGDKHFFSIVGAFVATGAFLIAMVAVVVAATRTGSGGGAGTASAEPVHVALSEFKISPNPISAPKGGSLHVTNNGTQVHNLSVEGKSLKTPDIKGGGSAELDISSLAPGTYTVLCLVPGHADSGMKATLTVTEGGGSGGAVEAAAGGSSSQASGGSQGAMDHSKEEWKAMDDAMIKGVVTYANSLQPGAAPLTKGQGNQKLQPKIGADGVKEFELTGAITDWEVTPGKVVKAWTYNGMVPAPWIRVEPGDKVRIKYTNNLPVNSDIHFHGVTVPNSQDGVAPVTQDPVPPNGGTFTYEFTTINQPELGMYHPHNHGQEAIPNGMFGIFQVGDVPLPYGKTVNGKTLPVGTKISQEVPMVLNDAGVIGLSLNGKGFPATGATIVNPGDWALIHYYNEGLLAHPMHLHGTPQLVVARDGFPLEQPFWVDTLNVAPGERYSVLINPGLAQAGIWAWHCHILNHAESDQGLMGMVTTLVVPDPNKKS